LTAAAALGLGPLGAGAAIGVLAAASALSADRSYAREKKRGDEAAAALDRLLGVQRSAPVHLDVSAMGALGTMAQNHNRLADRLFRFGSLFAELAGRLKSLPANVAGALGDAEKSCAEQVAAVEETASLLANINTSIRGVNVAVEQLAASNEAGSSSILQMGSAIEEVAGSAATLQATIESSTTSIHQLGASIRSVAENSDSVQRVAEETAASMFEMNRSIQVVGEHTRSAAQLTERVSQSAEEGSRAVDSTIEGIAEIRALSRDAKAALEGLASSIGEIGHIAKVISSVSDETNLLSLNAAIIAAQAGEHGRPFAVVADRVKTLARRTTASAMDIGRLIQAVQDESEKAVRAMERGIAGVEQGVKRSRAAGEILAEIRTAAREASGRVSEIARAAEEQAQNSNYVAEAGQRTSSLVQQISGAMSEQAEASEQLLQNATQLVEMSRQIARATDEQRTSSRAIAQQIERVTEMIAAIQRDASSHERASSALSGTFEGLLETALRSTRRIPEIASTIEEICHAADAMSEELGSG